MTNGFQKSDDPARQDLSREIERGGPDIARVLKPFLLTRSIIDGDTGERRDQKAVRKSAVMGGFQKDFRIHDKYAFTDPDSVTVTVDTGRMKHNYKGDIAMNSGTMDSATSTTFTDSELARLYPHDEALKNAVVEITGQTRRVTSYVSSTGKCTVATWDSVNIFEGTVDEATDTTFTDASLSAEFPNNTDLVAVTVNITGGEGNGQSRVISAYDSSTGQCTVPDWDTNPDDTSTFELIATASSGSSYRLTREGIDHFINAEMIGRNTVRVTSAIYLNNHKITLLMEGR